MTEAAFKGAGKAVGLELWRIEKLAPVRQPKVTGKFHEGDSYILLSTTQGKSGALQWAIHFWLGAESSSDEQGIAAYKTVELDDSLGGGPVQYREVQGAESALFLSYFKNTGGIEYLPGGVDSGFRKVERDVYETRLLHLKGKRTVRVSAVPLAKTSLNKGDVFVLDAGLKIYLFNGPSSNNFERAKGVEVASHIKDDERGGRAQIILLHEDPKNEEFWAHFGGFVEPSSLPEGEPDATVEQNLSRKLFKISDESGTLEFLEQTPANGGNHFAKSQLDTNDVFLLQSMHGKIFLWIGKKANINEKKEATARAVKYIAENNLPANTPVERVAEGTETSAFKAEFAVWDAPRNFNKLASGQGVAGAVKEQPVDVQLLLARKQADDTPVDDGKGKLKVWVVKNFKKEEVDEKDYGHFFGGDSYILLYSYLKGRSEEHIIYFWLGNDSTPDEKGAAALLTVELDDSMGGKPTQVRVTQGKEPAHFRQLFKGRMVVYKGGHASGFSGGDGSSRDQADTALFHIKGTNSLNTVAVEVDARASSLNSQDSFVLVNDSQVFVWEGRGTNKDEITVATNTATTLAASYKSRAGREVVPVTEGNEPAEFWSGLGGQGEYPQTAPGEAPPKDARLFSASTATGAFKVEEVDNFDQSDLNDEDVFLLDTYTQLFVWIGTQSTQQEKDKALEFAQKFVAEADDGRDPDLPIIRILAGEEPSMFSCHFHAWDAEFMNKRSFKDPYQARLEALQKNNAGSGALPNSPTLKKTGSTLLNSSPAKPAPAPAPAASAPAPAAAPAKTFAAPSGKHSLDDLKNGIPDGVDPTAKEEYLDDATFATVFSMDKAAFRALPKWKRDAAKKTAGLF